MNEDQIIANVVCATNDADKKLGLIQLGLEDLWAQKIIDVTKVAQEFGFPEYTEEVWLRQPAGVISLILKMKGSKTNE